MVLEAEFGGPGCLRDTTLRWSIKSAAVHEPLAKGCCKTATFELARDFAGKFSTLGC